MFSFHENLWPGDAPEPPNSIRAARGGPPEMVPPRKPEAGRRSRAIRVRVTAALSRPTKPMSGCRGSRTTQPCAASMILAT